MGALNLRDMLSTTEDSVAAPRARHWMGMGMPRNHQSICIISHARGDMP